MKSLFKPFSLKKGKLWQRFLCLCLALAIVINGLPTASSPLIPVAEAASNDPIVRYGLVAILVDKKLLEDKNDYPGLSEEYDDVDNERIVDRLQRYAEDVQEKNPYTKATIISVDQSQQGAPEIASTLEKLYFEGDGSNENAKLMGVVIVGEVPLPIVNKHGNRFLSLLPYTDFYEKSYLYNPATDDFEYDSRVSFPRVEIWHGVIKPPQEAKNDHEKASNIALFFDKNHLYHSGHKDFAEFDKNILLSDLYHERQLMSTGLFEYHKLFQKNAEDLTYLRNNKHWAEDLYKKFTGDVKEQTANFPEPILQPEYQKFLEDSQGLFGNLPDIQAKQAVIDKYHLPYVSLFSSYLSRINDWVSYTGRYSFEEAQSVPELISTKDQFTNSYLQEVNTALENKMDDLVKKSLQKYIPLISHSSLSGGIVVRVKTKIPDGDDADQMPDEIEIDEFLRFTHKVRSAQDLPSGGGYLADDYNYDSPLFLFLNSSLILAAKEHWPKAFTQVDVVLPVFEGEPPADGSDPKLEAEIVELILQQKELLEEGETEHAKKVAALIEDKKNKKKVEASVQVADANSKLYINGKPAQDIEGPLDCSLYRGSSLLTINNRIYNPRTAGKMLFLGAINKAVLDYNNYQQGLLVKSITPGSPAEKIGLKAGDLLLELNGQALNKDFGDGERIMLEDALSALDADKQSSATVKYFSKEQGKEVGPVSVTLENMNAPKWTNGCYGTNGIEIQGQDNSGKCIAQLSKIPLFDAGAGKEIASDQLHSGDDVDTAHIRSCYDIFYDEQPRYANTAEQFSKQPFVKLIEDFFNFNSDEAKKYLNPLAKFTPDLNGLSAVDSGYRNLAKDIILYNNSGYSLTFIDLLNHAGAFDGIDNDVDGEVDEADENNTKYAVNSEDWAEIGERVLSRGGTFRFDMPEVQGEVEIKIEPNVVKWISSMIPHKEPTNETIGAQAKAMATKSLPTDKNRYVAFLDKNGIQQKINYPNLFDATSYQDFQVRLYKLAKEIAAVPGSEKLIPEGEDYDATEAVYLQLLQIVEGSEDQYAKTETGHQVLQGTFKNKVEDALSWKNLGIDDKHDYILTTYLNPQKNAYIADKNGYEALYLVADGEHDYASFSFYGDYPAAALDITTLPEGVGDEPQINADAIAAEKEAAKKNNETLYEKLGKKKEEKESIPLLEWFPEMAIWLEETVESVSGIANYDLAVGMGGPSCKVGEQDIIEALTEFSEDEKATEGEVADLKIKMDKGTLRANGQDKAVITVQALDKFNHLLVNENKTEVELVIAPSGQGQVVSPAGKTKVVNGVATFQVTASRTPGDVIVQVATTNTPQRLLSNALQLKVTDRSVAVNTYATLEEALRASNEIEAGTTLPLQVQASLLDEQGIVLRSENGQKINFELDKNNTLASLTTGGAETAAGVASTELKAGTKTGILSLRASVNSTLYPAVEKDIYVMPADLNRINIIPSSSVIKSGGVSYTPVRIQLEDEYANIKNDEIYELTIWHDGPGEFKNIEDQNPNLGGIQVTAPEGVVEFVMSSTEDAGQIKIHAETFQEDPTEESEAQKFYNNATIQSRNDIYLSAGSSVKDLQADGKSQALITVSVNDSNGVVQEANLPVSLSISQEALAFFNSGVPKQVNAGKAYAGLQSNFISGKAEVVVAMPGFDSAIVPIDIRPLEPFRIEFIEPEGGLASDDVSTLELKARLLDKYDNFVDNDDSSNVFFSISEGTKDVAEFLTSSDLIAQNGEVTATLKSTYFSGPVRIKASGKGLVSDEIEIFSEKRMPSATFKNTNAKVLFASLLGNAFGDVNKENNLASSLLFSGYTEAISATTTPIEQKKILFTVGANGQVQLLDGATIKAIYGASNNKISSDKISFIDVKTDSVLAEASVLLPTDSFVKINGSGTGVHVQDFINSASYTLQEDGGDVLLLHNEIPQLRINGRGQIIVLQGNYNVLPASLDVEETQFLTFKVSSGTQQILTVQIRPSVSNDAIVVGDDYQFSTSSPVGAYLIQRNFSSDYKLSEFYTGNSNTSRKGLAWIDTTQTPEAAQVIGGPHTSLEGAFDKVGIGFTGQNKHMLLFFAGNSVGESFMPYASETGIVLGDPTVRLKPSGINNGFSADLGQSIYTDSENIKTLEKIDYNSDGVEDLLVAYEDGKVRMLEGVLGNPNKPFEDKGYLLNIVNGIYSLAVGDINNDQQQDIVVATKDSCRQGETCVYYFENFNGHFLQKNAGLNLAEKVSDLKIADLNKDNYGDILVADLNRSLTAFYGSKGGINTNGKYIGGLEASAQEGINTAHQTFIAYNRDGNEIDAISKSYGFDPFIPMNLPSANAADTVADDQSLSADDKNLLANFVGKNAGNLQITAAPVLGKKVYNFLPLTRDLRFDNSLKKTKDSNGGDVKSGDNLEYSITLVNEGSSITNAAILDYVPESFTLDKNSIKCEGCNLQVLDTGIASRPYLLTGINIGANQTAKITYSLKAATFPPLKLLIGENFADYPDDEYLDIVAFPEGKPENHVVYYSVKEGAQVNYLERFPDLPEAGATQEDPVANANQDVGFQRASLENDKNGNGIPDNYEGFNEDTNQSTIDALLPNDDKTADVAEYLGSGTRDKDLDGLPDAIDKVNGVLEDVADGIEATIGALKCSGGCIPMPVNMVLHIPFPVPGKINLFGIPAGYMPGIPLFAITKPSTLAPPVINTVIWPAGNPFYFESVFRIYASPTLTGGLGTAFCLGEYAWTEASKANSCFIFAVPVLQALGVCKALTDGIAGALNSVKSAVVSATGSGLTAVVSLGSNSATAANAEQTTGFSMGPIPVSASVASNVRIPGFPSVIVNWFDRQTEEIVDKLMDLPDIYLILPEPKSLLGGAITPTQEWENVSDMNDFLAYINSIPLIQLEQKEVPIKIPWLYEDQIEKTIRQYEQWIQNLKNEWERFKNTLDCDGDPNAYDNICNKLHLNIENIIAKMEHNIQMLEAYRELPKKLLQFRNFEAQYIRQLICYLDTIINYTGGYIQKQGNRVADWIRAIDQVKRTFQDWKVIVDIALTYAESCDACKTDRFSLLEFLLRFLVIIPDPPIIEMPKWPDIVIDVSQIQAGVKLVVPDFVFVPEPLILPPPPKFQFPDVILPEIDINVTLPSIPSLPEVPDISFFIPDLPSLPALPLPTLPDIPPPPKIPELPKPVFNLAANFNVLFRIFCLVKQGLLPLPETEVATQIEALTQRSLSPLLPSPFDMSLSFQLPPISYTYLNEIEVIAKLNLQLDINTIYDYVLNKSEVINSYTSYGAGYVNQKVLEYGKWVDQYVIDVSDIKIPDIKVDIDIPADDSPTIESTLSSYLDEQTTDLEEQFVAYVREVEKINAYSRSLPEQINLKAESTLIDTSHPIFDHSIEDIKRSRTLNDFDQMAAPQLVAYRDQLIAYHDSLTSGTSNLEKANDRDFMRFLAQENNAPLLADNSFNLREKSVNWPDAASKDTDHPLAQNIKEAEQIQERIIALTDEEKGISPTDSVSPKGLFIFNEKENVNQNLISYTEELGAVSHLVYVNVDEDDDEDIIYSFGGDVYLKRNYTEHESEYYDDDPEIVELKELIPDAPAVNYLTTTLNANEKTQIAWDPAATYDLAAYEVEIKYRFNDFDDQETAGSLAHVIPQQVQDAVFHRPDYYTYKVVKGELLVNGQNVETVNVPKIKANDLLQTSQDLTTEIHLTAFDVQGNNVGVVKLGPATNWVVPRFENNKNTQIVVEEGEIIFELKDSQVPYLTPGDTIRTGASARILVNYLDAGSFLLNANQTFSVPDPKGPKALAPMYVDDSSLLAKATITGKQRFITTEATGTVQDGDVLHMIEPSTLEAKASNGVVIMEISQPAHSLFTVPNGLPKDTIFYVKKGKVEVIRQASKNSEQKLVEGGMIDVKDFVAVYNGDITLLHSNSAAQAKVSENQTFALYSFTNAEKPEAEIELLNGSYYASMHALLKDNSRGTTNLSTILAPQSCGDKNAPYINVSETEKSIAVFQAAEINAASSFDSAGEVVAYYADTDLEKDSDNNGDKTDDKDLFSDDPKKALDSACFKDKKMDNPVFNFGPYNEPGEYKVKIFAVDQSCNVSGQEVTIKVFVPDIYLDPTSARSGILSGYIEPPLENVPIRFIRDRKPPLENFTTASADEQGVYYTNAAGEFTVTDLVTDNVIIVSDDQDKEIAQVDPYTGDITLKDNSYKVQILPARPPDFPTRAAIIDQNGDSVASFFIVPDLNNDTAIVEEINFDSNQLQIKAINDDDFSITKLPANDPVNPGATVITYLPENKQIVLINSGGNIFAQDDRVSLALKEQSNIHLIEILFNGQIIAEVYLPGQNIDGIMPTIAERDVYKFNAIGAVPPSSNEFTSPFADVDENTTNSEAILNLAEKGIIDGYTENGQTVFKPDQLIGRAEYTKILLKTLCIEPRPEAYEAPSTFSDIEFDENNLLWYYPFVKESYLQNFITGYVGEKDPNTGLNPFKPGNTITRAEAATIILSALHKQGIVNLEGIQPGNPWYEPYIEVAQNLGPYLNDPQENSQFFLLTAEEAAEPEKQITRAEFAIMAERVLNISNCYELDEDNDGMPTQWEKENNLNPYDPADAKFDDDKDELDNLGEYQNGTDPFNPDTDGGCMLDGPEVKATFNAAKNPLDDDPDFDGLSCDAEKTTYKTDPYKADTDGGGVNDGTEVLSDKTDPLFSDDDNSGHFDDVKADLEEGVYAIEESCNSCPCDSSIANKADILLGDDFWAVISAPNDANKIYKKSNSVTINDVP